MIMTKGTGRKYTAQNEAKQVRKRIGRVTSGYQLMEVMSSRSKPTMRVRKYPKPEYYFPTG